MHTRCNLFYLSSYNVNFLTVLWWYCIFFQHLLPALGVEVTESNVKFYEKLWLNLLYKFNQVCIFEKLLSNIEVS